MRRKRAWGPEMSDGGFGFYFVLFFRFLEAREGGVHTGRRVERYTRKLLTCHTWYFLASRKRGKVGASRHASPMRLPSEAAHESIRLFTIQIKSPNPISFMM